MKKKQAQTKVLKQKPGSRKSKKHKPRHDYNQGVRVGRRAGLRRALALCEENKRKADVVKAIEKELGVEDA